MSMVPWVELLDCSELVTQLQKALNVMISCKPRRYVLKLFKVSLGAVCIADLPYVNNSGSDMTNDRRLFMIQYSTLPVPFSLTINNASFSLESNMHFGTGFNETLPFRKRNHTS